jgi:hypothetical protein
MSRRKGQVEALWVNIREAQEIYLSSILKQRQAQELKKSNFLPFLSKGKHRCIPPHLGILLYIYHYVIVDCALTL